MGLEPSSGLLGLGLGFGKPTAPACVEPFTVVFEVSTEPPSLTPGLGLIIGLAKGGEGNGLDGTTSEEGLRLGLLTGVGEGLGKGSGLGLAPDADPLSTKNRTFV
jgi:hypothetical protein